MLRLLLFLLIIISSCRSNYYQIYQVEAKEVPKVKNTYIYENEDLRIYYSFWAEGGILNLKIENKSDIPLFMDWEHSNFIFNGYAYDYYNNTEEVQLSSFGVYNTRSVGSNVDFVNSISTVISGNISESGSLSLNKTHGSVRKEKPNVQIPPKSYIQAKIVGLGFPSNKVIKKRQVIKFELQNSPLEFRAYMGYSKSKNFDNLKYIDNQFWVSIISNIKASIGKKMATNDKFFNQIKKSNPGGTILLLVLLAGVVVISIN